MDCQDRAGLGKEARKGLGCCAWCNKKAWGGLDARRVEQSDWNFPRAALAESGAHGSLVSSTLGLKIVMESEPCVQSEGWDGLGSPVVGAEYSDRTLGLLA